MVSLVSPQASRSGRVIADRRKLSRSIETLIEGECFYVGIDDVASDSSVRQICHYQGRKLGWRIYCKKVGDRYEIGRLPKETETVYAKQPIPAAPVGVGGPKSSREAIMDRIMILPVGGVADVSDYTSMDLAFLIGSPQFLLERVSASERRVTRIA